MNKVVFSLMAGLAGLAVTPASAGPISPLSGLNNDTVQVAHLLVCDRFGRCYPAAHRNVRPQYIVRDYEYAPGPGNSYRHGYAPQGYAPGYYYGGPSIGLGIGGFGIGVGPRW